MSAFFALLKLQLLTRYADLKPKNLKNALKDKRGRTVGMMIAVIFLFVYLGVILYIIETKALDFLTVNQQGAGVEIADPRNLLVILAVMLSTVGTLVMAFFFIMSSLYLGRDATFLASLPIRPRMLMGAKLTQVWISETLIDAVIMLPACILYGTRVGETPDFYLRMVIVWLLVAVLPICIAAFLSAFLIRISALWKHREVILTVGGVVLFIAYMFLMMNVGGITGSGSDSQEMIGKFLMDNASRIAGMTSLFPPAGWAVKGLLGDWGQLALFAAVSIAGAALLVWGLGFFYRKLSLLQSETPLATGKKGIQKGSIREGNAFRANVKRELLTILRVPSYAVNILPISFMPVMLIVMMGVMFNRSAGTEGGAALGELMKNLNPAIVMCIMAAAVAYMAGMNPALSTAVTREGKGHDFIKSLPVSAKTLIHAKLAVGYGLVCIGVVGAFIALLVIIPGFVPEALLALVLVLLFCFACACFALSRDVKKPKLDWVTEQEAVKQNFGVLISMLVSWAVLIALAGIGYVLIGVLGWGTIPVFAVLGAVLAALCYGTYRLLMKNVNKYYITD